MIKTPIALMALLLSTACSTANVAIPASPAAGPIPDVVFVPTPFPVVDRMLDVARVGAGDMLFDLGSGDGRIVIAAAKRFGIRAVGIDIDPRRIEESNFNADTAGVRSRVDFRIADLFETDLRQASVVTLYLLPALNVRLRPKLFEELKPGSRVVSHSFDMGDWKADSTLSVQARVIYYWMIPADVAGHWDLAWSTASGERHRTLRIEQKYQEITQASVDGGDTVAGPRVRGDSVYFFVGNAGNPVATEFRGRVSGNTMTGTFTTGATSGTWRASRKAG
jgi:SAM-dependent methyltransferase